MQIMRRLSFPCSCFSVIVLVLVQCCVGPQEEMEQFKEQVIIAENQASNLQVFTQRLENTESNVQRLEETTSEIKYNGDDFGTVGERAEGFKNRISLSELRGEVES